MKRLTYLAALVVALKFHATTFAFDGPLPVGPVDPVVARSTFAEKAAASYSSPTDDKGKPIEIPWRSLRPNDFGSRELKFDQKGVRAVAPIPAAGVHPRIYFTAADLPDIRKRLKSTQCGQGAWKNILCWTEMMKGNYDDTAEYAKPDVWNGGFGGLHSRVPLFRLLGVARDGKSAYTHNPRAKERYEKLIAGDLTQAPDFYWNVFSLEAFRCLIDNDESGAKKLAKAVITSMKIDQAKRAADPKQKSGVPDQPVGAFQLAFTYDFIYNWLTPEQRTLIHDELALGSWHHDNYGTFNTAETSRSNWATFSYWLFEVLAVEGEDGFNDLKVRGMYRGWRNLLTYGWFQSGATYEGEAKNQLGMDGIIPFAMRAKAYGFENLCGHPYLRAYAEKFLPQSINPMQTGFHKYDLLGGSRAGTGGFTPVDFIGLKYMFPDDKAIDWVFRKSINEDYSGVPDRPDGYGNGLLFAAIFAMDYDAANNDPGKLNLGNTFFCGERALLMTRSSWDKDALMLNMHTRAANGGHAFADRNAIMVAGAGRIWSPNGYASFQTQENSVVCIDGKTQSLTTPGRVVGFQDEPFATFAVGDAKYCWDWTWQVAHQKHWYYTIDDVKAGKVQIPAGAEAEKHSTNDFAYLKLPFAYLNRPAFESPDWILPTGALSPVVRKPSYPVMKAFRTAGIVRGEHPYALVVDDIQKDSAIHHYDWTLTLESDIQIAKVDKTSEREMDIYLTGADPDQKKPRAKEESLPSSRAAGTTIPEGQPMLLVRILNRTTTAKGESAEPKIVQAPNASNTTKYQSARRLLVPADAVSPEFKVLLYPYRQGAAPLVTTWDSQHKSVNVTAGNTKDVISFQQSASGKTNLTVARADKTLIKVDQEAPALN